jgi:hypothetical protein
MSEKPSYNIRSSPQLNSRIIRAHSQKRSILCSHNKNYILKVLFDTMTTESSNVCLAPKAKRAVSFACNVTIRTTLHCNNYSSQEMQSCWYSRRERKQMRQEISYIVYLTECDHEESDDYDYKCCCTRGIQCFTREGARRRKENKRKAWDAVIQEQELQDIKGVDDPEMLAVIYRYHTSKCQIAAAIVGLADEKDCRRPTSSSSSVLVNEKRLRCPACVTPTSRNLHYPNLDESLYVRHKTSRW